MLLAGFQSVQPKRHYFYRNVISSKTKIDIFESEPLPDPREYEYVSSSHAQAYGLPYQAHELHGRHRPLDFL